MEEPGSQDALSLNYLKIVRIVLLGFGGWGDEQFGKKSPIIVPIQRKTVVLQTLTIFLGSLYFLYINYETLNLLFVGHILITDGMGIVMMIKSLMTNLKELDITLKEFVSFHLINFKHKGPHYKKIYDLTNKVSYYFTIIQITGMVVVSGLFNLTPLYINYNMGAFASPRPENLTLDFSIWYTFPGFKQEDHFILTTILNAYYSYLCAIISLFLDLLVTLMVFQIVGHIKIIMIDLETIKRPKMSSNVTIKLKNTKSSRINVHLEKYDVEENKAIHVLLTEVVNHHKQVVGFVDRISHFFGPMLALNYLFQIVSLCILLMECSQKDPNTLARFGLLTLEVFTELIEISVIFDFVNYMSEKLMDSVYYSPWECMDIRNQRTVQFLLHRVQTPMQVTAMGIVPVGVQTMQGVIKTTLSYYAILQSLNDN